MAAVRIGFDAELSELSARQALDEMLKRMDDRKPFYKSVGDRMLGSTKDRFFQEDGPDGTPWAALRRATVRSRERRKQLPIQMLRATGYLAGSIHAEVSSTEVRVGSPVEYAAIHQLGGTIQRPARQAKIYRKKDSTGQVGRRFVAKKDADYVTDVSIPAYTITIPARPFLGLTAGDEAGIFEDAEAWLLL